VKDKLFKLISYVFEYLVSGFMIGLGILLALWERCKMKQSEIVVGGVYLTKINKRWTKVRLDFINDKTARYHDLDSNMFWTCSPLTFEKMVKERVDTK
jgi:hypothetical protein